MLRTLKLLAIVGGELKAPTVGEEVKVVTGGKLETPVASEDENVAVVKGELEAPTTNLVVYDEAIIGGELEALTTNHVEFDAIGPSENKEALVEQVVAQAETFLAVDDIAPTQFVDKVSQMDVEIVTFTPGKIREAPEASIFANLFYIVTNMGDKVTKTGESGEDLEPSKSYDHCEFLGSTSTLKHLRGSWVFKNKISPQQ